MDWLAVRVIADEDERMRRELQRSSTGCVLFKKGAPERQ
jgi:hypothetical protein